MESKKCKYCNNKFYKKDFPKCFNRMITCGSIQCKKKYKKEWSFSNTCSDCGKPIVYFANKCKSCISKGESNPFYNKTHTKETKKKIKLFQKGMVSLRKGVKLSKEQIEKTSSKLRGRKPSRELIRKRLCRREISSLELKMINLINKYNLPYKFVGNGKFFIERKCPDFINTLGKKIAVEVFYKKHKEMFSGGLEDWKSKRKEVFNNFGWDIIFLDETKVNENIKEILI